MHIFTWTLQLLLATMFCLSGLMILFQPKEKLAPKMPFVNDYTPAMVKLVAFAHLLGATGLVIPQLLNIIPVLTPIAACCLAVMMLLAVKYNWGRGDTKGVVVDVVFCGLFIFIAYYRF